METLTEKMCIIKGSRARGSVDLDNLTNFPQVIMPPKFKALEFVKYDDTRDPCAHLGMFCRTMAPYGDNLPSLRQISLIAWLVPRAHGMWDWKKPPAGERWLTSFWSITNSTLRNLSVSMPRGGMSLPHRCFLPWWKRKWSNGLSITLSLLTMRRWSVPKSLTSPA